MGLFSGMWEALKGLFGASSAYDPSSPTAGGRLYVGNLSYQVKEDELRSLFAKYGRVKSLHLIRDRFTRKLKGYAFVEMSPEDAQKALSLNGVEFLGRKLVVSIAKSKQRQPSSGGGSPRREGGRGKGQGSGGGSGQTEGRGNRWRRRRSGPKVYGSKDDTPIQRYE